MNKQQIQALIDAKIAGQGSAVDVGGALPTILHEILEAAFAGANVQSNWNETNSDSPQFIQNKPTIPAPYSLPTASAETLGGVKVGENLSIDPETGVLSASGGGTGNAIVLDLSAGEFADGGGQTMDNNEFDQEYGNGLFDYIHQNIKNVVACTISVSNVIGTYPIFKVTEDTIQFGIQMMDQILAKYQMSFNWTTQIVSLEYIQ